MKTVLAAFSPHSLNEALEILDEYKSKDIKIIAGGTDVMVEANYNNDEPAQYLLGTQKLTELSFLEVKDGKIRIGPNITHSRLVSDPFIAQHVPVLALAAKEIGSLQIRNRGTIGGNICNSSPVGDLLPALVTLNAQLELSSRDGMRTIPISDFFTGPRKNQLKPGEMLTGIVTEKITASQKYGFRRLSPRKAVSITKASVSFLCGFENETFTQMRIALGSVGPVIIRAENTQCLLEGQKRTNDLLLQVPQTIKTDCKPIGDVRSTAAYRHYIVGTVLKQLLEEI